jgi:superfamily II DNA or RNA helicase
VKTIIAAKIIKDAAAQGQRALVLAHRREIIKQTSRKLLDAEVDHGILAAGLIAFAKSKRRAA